MYNYVAGHFVPSVNIIRFQTRSVCFNPGQFGAGTKHKSQVTGRCSTNTETTLTLGLRLALINVEDTFCIGKTMTCDLCLYLPQTDLG